MTAAAMNTDTGAMTKRNNGSDGMMTSLKAKVVIIFKNMSPVCNKPGYMPLSEYKQEQTIAYETFYP